MTLVLSGGEHAGGIRSQIRKELSADPSLKPGLAVIIVGDDPASAVYVASKERACTRAGIRSVVIRLDGSATQPRVLEKIRELNSRDDIHGILVQLPLPDHISPDAVASAVHPGKDVDGFHPENVGRLWRGENGLFPCTPSGIIGLLEHYDIPLEGRNAVIAGRSNIVGKPMAALLLRKNCTVTIAHSRTRGLPELCASADILIAAVGRPGMIGRSWIKPGAVVVDVGINRTPGGQLTGDVSYNEVFDLCSAITPVPGGVGPLTIAYLLKNTFLAASAPAE
jgi:methylenetetrahydrofolate dehydrogenase (NADP+) / methenyltetrahydrofolate cyclohydrolase